MRSLHEAPLPVKARPVSPNAFKEIDTIFREKFFQILPKDLLTDHFGRLDGVVLRLLTERQSELVQVHPTGLYIHIKLELPAGHTFFARLLRIKEKSVYLPDRYHAEAVVYDLAEQKFIANSLSSKELKLLPPLPFCVKDIMIEASCKYGISADEVYETIIQLVHLTHKGKNRGLVALGTFNSVQNLQSIIQQTRELIFQDYGNDYLPRHQSKLGWKSLEKKRFLYPSSVRNKPKSLQRYLTKNQNRIYAMIWTRFVASLMRPAKVVERKIIIAAGPEQRYMFQTNARDFIFRGYYQVYQPENSFIGSDSCSFPREIVLNRELKLLKTEIKHQIQKEPGQYSEAELLTEIRDLGTVSEIAGVISRLIKDGYAERQNKKLLPTQTGLLVGKVILERYAMLTSQKFQTYLFDRQNDPETKDVAVSELLDKIINRELQTVKAEDAGLCPECGKKMVLRVSRFGKFYACSGYPHCTFTQSPSLDLQCPLHGCDGRIIKRRSKNDQIFYGCTMYPACSFTSSQKPVKKICPFCGHPYLIGGSQGEEPLLCPNCNNSIATDNEIFS
ncbi:topoisomerase DNA-binding C4 zinc finger domain-containing protein [candidate division KSB1 bacterium]|nr:topoisomerase DNA-binding C4 zinc finger domain-containing protein [candidate division KSB1 bacterium]